MFSNIVEKTIKTCDFFLSAISLSSAYNKKDCKEDFRIKIRWSPFPLCFSFHKTHIKLQFYFSLRLMFKYFAIHVFFTPAWDFTSVFLTGVKSDRREISLCLERVTTLGLYVETEVSSIHFTADCRSEIIHVTTPLILTPKYQMLF